MPVPSPSFFTNKLSIRNVVLLHKLHVNKFAPMEVTLGSSILEYEIMADCSTYWPSRLTHK